MDILKRGAWLACALIFAAGLVSLPAAGVCATEEPTLVGRISFTEGEILRYVPDTKDWVATVKDAPFGLDDALYSDQSARAEFIMPNGVWVRIGGSTQIQLIALKDDVGEMDVAAGVARFYNKSSDAALKVTTPFGYVLSDPGSAFDVYVGDQSVEVTALSGNVDFIHQESGAKYDVGAGSESIVADDKQVAAGEGTVDESWDEWNSTRDSLWAKRTEVKGDSVNYLPPQLDDEAYELEENGRWERVYYDGEYQNFWRPTAVAPGWRPFTVGRWTEWYGDQCWVPAEPFGYVTHHYGNWVFVNNAWYWAPPLARPVARGPFQGYAWYPGRVAWISDADDIGWVPLAPTEVYYAHRPWGWRTTVITAAPVTVSIGALAFAGFGAVVVPQARFYGVPSYAPVVVAGMTPGRIRAFSAAPVINRTVIYNRTIIHERNRYNFSTVHVAAKPHMDVVRRIEHNRQLATRAGGITPATLKRGAAGAAVGRPVKGHGPGMGVQPPRVSNKIVPANQVSAPRSSVQFKPTALKPTPKQARTLPAGATGGAAGAGRTMGPGTRQGGAGIRPSTPGQTAVPGVRPATPGTAAGGQAVTPGARQRPVPPTRAGQGTVAPGVSQGTPGTAAGGQAVSPATRQRPIPPTRAGQGTTAPGQGTATRIITGPGRTGTPGTQPASRGAGPGVSSPGATGTMPGQVRPATPRTPSGITPATQPGQRVTPSGQTPSRLAPGTQPTTRGGGAGMSSPGAAGTVPGQVRPATPRTPSRVTPATQPGQGSQPQSRTPSRMSPQTQTPQRMTPATQPGQGIQPQSRMPSRVSPQAQPTHRVQPQAQTPNRVSTQAQPVRRVQPQAQTPARVTPQAQPVHRAQPQVQAPARQAPAQARQAQPKQGQKKPKPGEPGYVPGR